MSRSKFYSPSRRRKAGRGENTREVKPRFLMICEDGKSAPAYFNDFRLTSATVVPVGTGFNTISLVEEAISYRDRHGFTGKRDITWVVMDRDSFPKDNYDNAFRKAKANGIEVCFSNECIEVWFLMHFTESSKFESRKKLPGILGGHRGVKYEKGMRGLFTLLLPNISVALKNAAQIRQHHEKGADDELCHCCPSTNADELVTALLKYM